MNDKLHVEKLLTVTNPVWLWLFAHGWEDPEWGKTAVGQVTTASLIHELANKLNSADIRKQIQVTAAKAIAEAAKKM